MKRKDRIYAFLGQKPKGRDPNRYWPAFSFSPNAIQNDVEAFMVAIHVLHPHYWLHMESSLRHSNSTEVTQFFYKSKEYGDVWVYDTPIKFSWGTKMEDDKKVRNRVFAIK